MDSLITEFGVLTALLAYVKMQDCAPVDHKYLQWWIRFF